MIFFIFFYFFLFVRRASPPVLDPTVTAQPITVDPNSTDHRTGGDAVLDPAVTGYSILV